MKTSELTGPALDWAVAMANGWTRYDSPCRQDDGRIKITLMLDDGSVCKRLPGSFTPSTNWSQGGPIIERENINLSAYELDNDGAQNPGWQAWPNYGMSDWYMNGPTPLIAAMRCYCVSRLGDEVELPEELRLKP